MDSKTESKSGLDQPKRTLSWATIVIIWLSGIGVSLAASYLVQRYLLDKPHPDFRVGVTLGAMVPFLILLSRRRKR